MKIIKIGTFDEKGLPTGWEVDASDVPDGAVIIELKLDGRILVDRVEIVPWTETRKEERIKTLNATSNYLGGIINE
jgi:hypothetical protein